MGLYCRQCLPCGNQSFFFFLFKSQRELLPVRCGNDEGAGVTLSLVLKYGDSYATLLSLCKQLLWFLRNCTTYHMRISRDGCHYLLIV